MSSFYYFHFLSFVEVKLLALPFTVLFPLLPAIQTTHNATRGGGYSCVMLEMGSIGGGNGEEV